VPRRFPLSLLGLALLTLACGGPGASPASTPAGGGPGAPAGSPVPPTPTAQVAKPASPAGPSPRAVATPVPAAVASPLPSPIAAASPTPVAVAPSGGAIRYRIVPEQSEARYIAREKFVERPLPNEAIGTTKEVSGEIELERPGTLRGRVLNMRVDLRTLTSDQARRDNYIRQNTLQTEQFPFAEFRSTGVAGPAAYMEGEEASFQMPGSMTIRDQERPMTWDVSAKLQGGTMTGVGTATIKLTDFGMQPPRLAILTVEDEMRWEVSFGAERAP
jgi:polyisoprenoid-binding protein YceI